MSGTTAPFSSQAAARLAGAPAPERVRQLLQAVHGIAAQVLASPLQLTMVQLERELFGLAEKARNSQVQADVYAQIRQLGAQAAEFPGWFLDALAEDLARLRRPSTAGNAPASTPAPAIPAMSLVTDTDIDRDIVLHEMARRESYRAQSHLQLLGQRFGVLAAQPAFDAESLPVGPYALCRILRACGERLGLNLEAQRQLYHVFERQAMERHVELLDRLNMLLAREGVLPGLVYIPYLPRPAGQRRTAGGPAAAPDPVAGTGAGGVMGGGRDGRHVHARGRRAGAGPRHAEHDHDYDYDGGQHGLAARAARCRAPAAGAAAAGRQRRRCGCGCQCQCG